MTSPSTPTEHLSGFEKSIARWGWGAGLATAAVLLAVGAWAWGEVKDNRLQNDQQLGDAVSRAVLGRLAKGQYAAHVLMDTLHGAPMPNADEFDKHAGGLLHGLGHGVSLQWAPQGVVRYIHPLAGNEAAIGHDLRADPARRAQIEQLIHQRDPQWAGPFHLKQGGQGLIYRVPVFDEHAPGQPFKGVTNVLFTLPVGLTQVVDRHLLGLSDQVGLRVSIGEDREHLKVVYETLSGLKDDRGQDLPPSTRSAASLLPFSSQTGTELTAQWDEPGGIWVQVEVMSPMPMLWLYQGVALALLVGALVGLLVARMQRERWRNAVQAHAMTEMNTSAQLLHASTSGVLLFKRDGGLLMCNPTALRLLQTSSEAVEGLNIRHLASWQQSGLLNMADEVMADGVVRQTVYEGVTSMGTSVCLQVGLARIELGGTPHLQVQLADVSALRAQEKAAQRMADRLSTALRTARLGVWEWDMAANTVLWDQALFSIYGLDVPAEPSPMPYQRWAQAVHPADLPLCESKLKNLLSGTGSYDPQFRIRWPSGTERVIRADAYVERDAQGQPVRMVGFNVDVTDEVAERARSVLLTEVVDQVDALVGLSDAQGVLQFINKGGRRLLGMSENEPVRGRTVATLLMPESARRVYEDIIPGMMVTGEWQGELELQHVDGHAVLVRVDAALHRDAAGNPTHLSGLMHDISQDEQAKQELRQAKREAEAANQAKSQFLSNMSHELRTPLNAILGFGRLLEGAPLSDDHRDHLRRMNQSGHALLQQINDLLDFSKIEAGEFSLFDEVFGLDGVLAGVQSMMDVLAQQKGLKLTVHPLPAGLPKLWQGDPVRLRQMLVNLVGNALKFTDVGGVTVDVTHRADYEDGTHRLRFEVTDTGSGIAPNQLSHLFERFKQVEDTNTRRHGGSGLGLAIVKQLAEAMGGQVSVQSTVGQGSRFAFEVVLREAEAGAVAPTLAPAVMDALPSAEHLRLDGLRVLVVDDSEANRQVVSLTLAQEGVTVHTAHNGLAALQWLKQCPVDVDAVLMDVQMPVMDGNTAVAQLRQDPRWADLPVVAMTAGATRSEREIALGSGMTDYLVKPFEPETLVRLLRHWVGKHRGAPLGDGRLRAEAGAVAAPEAASSEAWPDVPGLDMAGAKVRMHGDWPRCQRLWRALFDEFEAVATPEMADPRLLPDTVRLMHKLVGNSALLGGVALAQVARQAENDLKALQAQTEAVTQQAVMSVLSPVRHSLVATKKRLQGVLADRPRAVTSALPELDADQLAQLRQALQNSDFVAVTVYERLRPALESRMSEADALALDGAMTALAFERALALLPVHSPSA